MQVLTASWVVTVAGAPLRDGRVAVDEGRIVWVGQAGDSAEPSGPVRDLGPGVLLPGLVNAHCHLELSHLAGRVPYGAGFVAWVEALVATRASDDAAVVRAAAGEAVHAMVEGGTVAVGDVSNGLAHLDLLGASRLESVVFLELLAWDPARAAATLEWADGRLAALAGTLAPNVRLRLAAHAPYSVSPALFAGLVARGGPGAMHLAESPAESQFLATGDGDWPGFLERRGLGHVAFDPPGLSPVGYADGLGALRPGLVAAHGVQVDGSDRAVLARRGVFVALCPRSNRNLGAGTAPVPKLLAAGVRLCLGTDSLASVESLDVLEDAVLLRQQFPDLDPAAILRMATLGGAEALGLPDLGAIVPGRRAALAFAPSAKPPEDPHRYLLSGEARLERIDA
jgi:cytosine/adenosine deaminase-related metal-dependent hydrolase